MEARNFSDEILSRVLLLAPTRRDGEVTAHLLMQAGTACLVCKNLPQVVEELKAGAGAVLLTEEAIVASEIHRLLRALEEQPAWSDVPVVILMQGGVASPAAASALRAMSNVTLLERPAPTRSVVSAVQAAVRGRVRQYQIRDQLDAIRAAQDERQQLLESERAARQEAERVSRIKDEFLATLSHELRTPLNAIFGWSQILRMSYQDPPTVLEGIEVIDRNVRAQTQLIEDLLDMSRIISGKVRLDVETIELRAVIDAALEAVLPALTAKGLRLEKSVDSTIAPINGDSGRLQQVLWNLLTNAIKFTPQGGTIEVRAERVDSMVEIKVSDTGEGIPPDFLPQLFERFSQADASTTRKHGGLGIGLSIVRNLVEMHGGTIEATSAGPGKGATFTIRLPVQWLNTSPKEKPSFNSHRQYASAGQSLPDLNGLKILVVDDEPDAREMVRRFLIQSRAVPTLAASAAEAHEILSSYQPDIIISDIGMPVQDGYEFMRAVRMHGLNAPAVALTAFARPEDRLRSIQAGYQMHLPKPVEPMELVELIANLAHRR